MRSRGTEESEMELQPHATWDFRQLQKWEQQIKKSYNPAPNGKDNEEDGIRLDVLEAASVTTSTNAKHNPEEAIDSASSQPKRRKALLSLSPKTDVINDSNHDSEKNQERRKHGLWDTKMWRQKLFDKYVNQWNRVHQDNSVEINYSDDVENWTLHGLEEFAFENGEDEGCHVDKENRQRDSEQYFKTLRRWATRSTTNQEETCGRTQAESNGENQTPQDEVTNTNRSLQARRGHETERSRTFARRGSRITPQDSEDIPDTSPSDTIAIIRPKQERGGGEQKTEDTKKDGGRDKPAGAAETERTRSFGRRGSRVPPKDSERIPNTSPSQTNAIIRQGKAHGGVEHKIDDTKREVRSLGNKPEEAVLKRSELKCSDRQPEGGKSNTIESPRKEALKGRTRIQGAKTQDGGTSILHDGKSPTQLDGCKPNSRGESKTLPLKGRGKVQVANSQDGGIVTIVESEIVKKHEAFESKGIKCREINSTRSKESNRRGEGSTKEIREAQDPKGYNSTSETGGKDSLEGESRREEKQDKGRQQQWSQVDWTACDNKKRRAEAAAPSLLQWQPRNAAVRERKSSSRQPSYRTIYRVKDTYCEEVRHGEMIVAASY